MKRTIYIFAAAVFLAAAGCISLEDYAPSVDQKFMEVSKTSHDYEKLKKGRHLYTARCGTCHSLDAVNDYSEIEWHEIMYEEEMADKSKFSKDDTIAVLNYIEAATVFLAEKEKMLKQNATENK